MAIKTNLGLVAWALGKLGNPYWFGTTWQKCTESLLSGRRSIYPSHYTSSRMSRYRADIKAGKWAADCSGLIKGYWWTNDNGQQVRGLDGRPDITANMMYDRAKVKGSMGSMPEIPGLLLHFPGHIGIYVGNGWAVEARGFAYGIVKTRVSSRPWKHWLKSNYIDYVEDDGTEDKPDERVSYKRLLKYRPGTTMMRGSDVLFVQKLLAELGYKPGTQDGIFGSTTASAVKAFQNANRLEVDGDVGRNTWAALEKADKATASEEEPGSEEPATPQKDADEVIDDDDDRDDAGADGSGIEKDEPVPTYDFGTRILKYRKGYVMQTGADVVNVQKRLEQLGHDVGKVDGIYGPGTAAAVRAFQKSVRITVDGEVGPNTRKKLS